MMSWAVELSEYHITYQPRTAIKAQALADFLAEMTTQQQPPAIPTSSTSNVWKLFVDGSSNAKGSGAGVIIENPDGVAIEHSLTFEFNTTNNQAEYEAIIAGLAQASELGASHLKVFSDSQLVTSQISGEYQAKGPLMAKYLAKVKNLMQQFQHIEVQHVRRADNTRADVLSKLASTKSPGNNRTVIQHSLPSPCFVLVVSSITRPEINTWMSPIIDYLSEGSLPQNPEQAKKIIRQSTSFTLLNGQLYKKGFSHPLLKCLGPSRYEFALLEVHEGINGHHMGGRALAKKIARAGYYWPTLEKDAMDHVKKCEQCQRHADKYSAPPEPMTCISSPWPFYKWGMDLLGPFPKAAGQVRWLIVAIDYFTRWVEAEPLATITSQRVQKFFLKHVVYRFGIPGVVISDNGTQFTDSKFRELLSNLHIQHRFSAVEHPQSNGLVESANKMLAKGIKKRVEDQKGAWVENLDSVLWGYRTTAQSSTKETPFRLTYGVECMIPIEVGEPSFRFENTTEEANSLSIREELDLLEERRDNATLVDHTSKERSAARYNKRVVPRNFEEKDLVMRRADIGNKNASEGKLAPNWEGPYRVVCKLGGGAYSLETLDGKAIPRAWNADKLRKYYS